METQCETNSAEDQSSPPENRKESHKEKRQENPRTQRHLQNSTIENTKAPGRALGEEIKLSYSRGCIGKKCIRCSPRSLYEVSASSQGQRAPRTASRDLRPSNPRIRPEAARRLLQDAVRRQLIILLQGLTLEESPAAPAA